MELGEKLTIEFKKIYNSFCIADKNFKKISDNLREVEKRCDELEKKLENGLRNIRSRFRKSEKR